MESPLVDIQSVDGQALGHLRARSRAARTGAHAVSAGGRNGLIWWVLSVALIRFGKTQQKQAAVDGVLAWSATQAAGFVVKRLFDRRRPSTGIGKQPDSPSMPSTHTANAFAYTVAAGCRSPDLAVPLAALAITVGWSRLALNRHFPTDVLAGAVLGSSIGLTIAGARRPLLTHTRTTTCCPRGGG
jgi:membrane-associated phospholipid phosphatase